MTLKEWLLMPYWFVLAAIFLADITRQEKREHGIKRIGSYEHADESGD